MKSLVWSLLVLGSLSLSACHKYIDPNASVDGVVGTVGGAFGNISIPSGKK